MVALKLLADRHDELAGARTQAPIHWLHRLLHRCRRAQRHPQPDDLTAAVV
jgi:hypothetical protein